MKAALLFFGPRVGGCLHKIPTFVATITTHAAMKKQRPIEHILVVRLTDVAKAAMSGLQEMENFE